MTTDIQLLRSAVAFKRPAAAPLLDGQAAVNYNVAEPGLFFRLTSGGLMKIGPVAMTTDGSRPNSAATGETGNSLGEQWLNALTTLYRPVQYVYDGNEFVTSSGFTVDEASGNFTLERTLRAQRLESNTLLVEGPAVIGGNITPNGQNCAYFLGGANERWDTAFLCSLDVLGDVSFGTDCSDTFTVTAETTFNCDVTFNSDDIVLGNGCGVSTILLDGETTFNCDTVFNQNLAVVGDTTMTGLLTINGITTINNTTTINSDLTVTGNTTIGTDCTDTLVVTATTDFNCPVNFNAGLDVSVIGQGCGVSTLLIDAVTTLNCVTTINDDLVPSADNTIDLGSPTQRFANIYTGDLHLRNDRGDWTVIEEEEYLSLRNNKTGKMFRLVMEEV